MGRTTGIQWTDATYNPIIGCHKVSKGCKNCYAERIVERYGQKFSVVRRASTAKFNEPLRWKGPGRAPKGGLLIFTCSLSDFFIDTADPWRDEMWEIIRRTPMNVYQILSKRPERIADHLPRTCFKCGVGPYERHVQMEIAFKESHGFSPWPWPNVWLGTSAEDQATAEQRIPILTSVPAKVHFLSCEPLLGPIRFRSDSCIKEPVHDGNCEYANLLDGIEWVIAGGESGRKARPMDLDWARSVRDQCDAQNVPFFFKQIGGNVKCKCHHAWGCELLDGEEYKALPRRSPQRTLPMLGTTG